MGRPPNCSCQCEPGFDPNYYTDACEVCDVAPLVWEFAVAGLATVEGDCDCTQMNGTYELHHVGGCVWASEEFEIDCGFGFSGRRDWVLTKGDPFDLDNTDWILRLRTLGIGSPIEYGRWVLSEEEFACLGSNDLAKNFTDVACIPWPDPLTISPLVV